MMRIEVLGPSRMSVDGAFRNLPAGVGGMLLQALIVRPNQVVAADTLASELWPGDDHRRAERLRVVASRLRSSLAGSLVVEAVNGGYRLRASASSLDQLEFMALARRAFDGDEDALHAALGLWRGDPYGGFIVTPAVCAHRAELVATHDRLRILGSGKDGTENDSPAHTLYHPPSVRGGPRFHALLKQLPSVGDVRLITVVAPAGMRKAILLARWAARETGRIGWLRLRGQENEPGTFWYSLGAAFASVAPGVLVAHPGGPEVDSDHLLAHVLNGLMRSDTALGVVVDGFHLITNRRIHQQMDMFLRRFPSGHTIAIASQEPLPLRTSRLRACQDMVAVDIDPFRPPARAGDNRPQGRGHRVAYNTLADAVAQACAYGDADSVRRLLTSAEPNIALADPASREVCLPAAALLGPGQRRRWMKAASRTRILDAAAAAAKAVNLYRSGQCRESLATAESGLSLSESPASSPSRMVLVATIVACQIMLGLPVPRYRDHRSWGATSPGAWPWLTRWELGQRALLAYVSGDSSLARVLVDDAAGTMRGLHNSWEKAADGITIVTSTLLDSALARTRADQRHLAGVLDAAIHGADRAAHASVGIAARYAAWLVHLRAENHDAASMRLAEACAGLKQHPGLPFLIDFWNRLTHSQAADKPQSELDRLSSRERQVLSYLATDLTMGEIGGQLYLSPHTVRSHVRSVYRKLGVRRRIQAITYATPTDEL